MASLRRTLSINRRSVPPSDLTDRALGIGDPHGPDKAVGKHKARWAKVDLTGLGLTIGTEIEIDVPHDLGSIPTMVTLKRWENSGGPVTLIANARRPENWSHSHVHVGMDLIAGSATGCTAWFLVEGK